MSYDELDFHLVSDEPSQLFMGELPRRWEEVPTRVVVNLCGVYPVGEPYGRIVHGMALLDVLDPQLVPTRQTFESFLDAVHIYAGTEATYWHCHAGLNRSGLAVAAYLHRYRGLRISDAIGHLRRTRTPMVLCNNVFEATLRDWYGDDDEKDFDVIPIDTYLARRGGRGGP